MTTESGSKSLFAAILLRDLSGLGAALAAGADPDARYGEGPDFHADWTAVHAAVKEHEDGGPLEALVLLLRVGANADGAVPVRPQQDSAYERLLTPLLLALALRCNDAALLLLAAGANPDVIDDEGEWPLGYCIAHEDWAMAATIIRCGARLTLDRWGGIITKGWTILGEVASRLDLAMVELLLAHGADPYASDDYYLQAWHHMPEPTTETRATWDAIHRLLAPRPPAASP